MRGLVGAGIFLVLMLLVFGRPFGQAFALSLAMLAIYVPLGYMVDNFFFKRRLAGLQREKQRRRP
jgi:hypothetical protein